MTTSRSSRRLRNWLLTVVFVLFMALVVYRSLHVAGYQCDVCITFRGQSVCRTVEGPTELEARSAAINNACAGLASGVTDSMACERRQPDKLECAALN